MAKAILNVPSLQLFDTTEDQTSLGQRWETWLKSFNYFATVSGVTDKRQKEHCCYIYLEQMIVLAVREVWESETPKNYPGTFKN